MSSLSPSAPPFNFWTRPLFGRACCLEVLWRLNKPIVTNTIPLNTRTKSLLENFSIYSRTPSTIIQIRSNTSNQTTHKHHHKHDKNVQQEHLYHHDWHCSWWSLCQHSKMSRLWTALCFRSILPWSYLLLLALQALVPLLNIATHM